MCSADFGCRVRSRGTSIAWPVEYSRCTRSINSSVRGIVSRRSTSDSRRRIAMGIHEVRESSILYNRAMKSVVFAWICALACALALATPANAAEEAKARRLALVIGNGAYKDAPLSNPPNDAADMARALEA